MTYFLRVVSLFLSFIIVGGSSLAGQEVEENKKVDIHFGMKVALQGNYRTLTSVSTFDNFHPWWKFPYEKPRTGITFGLVLDLGFTDLVSFTTGLQYAIRGYSTRWVGIGELNQSPDACDPEMELNDICPESAKISDSYHFMEIPLKVNFIFGKGAFRPFGSIGLIPSLLIDQKQFYHHQREGEKSKTITVQEITQYNRFYVSGIIQGGVQYDIETKPGKLDGETKFIRLRLAPFFRHDFPPFTDDEISGYLWSVGVGLSIL